VLGALGVCGAVGWTWGPPGCGSGVTTVVVGVVAGTGVGTGCGAGPKMATTCASSSPGVVASGRPKAVTS
jgi:hypothetical protein